jgi:hypothetical protein
VKKPQNTNENTLDCTLKYFIFEKCDKFIVDDATLPWLITTLVVEANRCILLDISFKAIKVHPTDIVEDKRLQRLNILHDFQ